MMKKKILMMFTLALAMCGTLAAASACGGKGGDKNPSSAPDSSVDASYNDEIKENPMDYTVTVATGEGYRITAVSSVLANEDLEFDVQFDANFDATSAVVKANGVAVIPENGKYLVRNVSDDITLSVTGLVRKSYSVLLVPTDGVTISGNSTVNVGSDYSFTVALNAGATKGADFAVKANGVTLTSDTDTYSVTGVDKDVVITVSGVNAAYYSVSGLQGTGYDVSVSADKIQQGKDFFFAVNLDEAYEKTDSYEVSVVGGTLEEKNGVYTVKNVQGNVVISVSGIKARESYTITYMNCDLAPGTAYSGTQFILPTPARAGYLFDGWKDADGNDFVMDYNGSTTVYASWMTESGVDYVKEGLDLREKIQTRYDTLHSENRLQYLNVQDYETYVRYTETYANFTDYEKTVHGEDSASVKAFLQKVKDVPHTLLLSATDDISVTYKDPTTEESVPFGSGYTERLSISKGKDFDGRFWALQSPDANAPSLSYTFTITPYNYEAACLQYGRVSLYMNGNYAYMTLLCEGEMIAYTAAQHILQRIDIQDGYLYVNGVCRLQLSEEIYKGEKGLNFTVLRLDNSFDGNKGHYYGQWDISNVYGGNRLEGLSTVIDKDNASVSAKENIFSNKNDTAMDLSDEIRVNGAEKAYTYAYTGWANAALDDFALGEYESLKFYVKVTGKGSIYVANSETAIVYFDKLVRWTEIKLLKNGSGYDVYVNGVKSSAISGVTNLNQLAFNGTTGVTVSYTNLIAKK